MDAAFEAEVDVETAAELVLESGDELGVLLIWICG